MPDAPSHKANSSEYYSPLYAPPTALTKQPINTGEDEDIEETKQGPKPNSLKIDDSSSDGECSYGSTGNERMIFTGDENEMNSETKSATQKPLMSSSITSMKKMLHTQERKGKTGE